MNTEKQKMTREDFDLIFAEREGGENADQPEFFLITADLGNLSGEDSTWGNLLDAIAAAEKYVSLDLSACTMHGADFNPAVGIETGKEKIVSIILPSETKSIGLHPADGEKAAFRHFANLKSVSGKGVESIGEYAFYDCKKLAGVDFPAAACIGEYAFSRCSSLASVEFPSAVTIGEGVFNE